MPITPEQIEVAQSLQHAAAHDTHNQVRLVAGPGTGKSYSIEERVRCLIADKDVNADSVFVVSFTRASARHLRDRIQKYCSNEGVPKGARVSVTTLHSLALRVLQSASMLSAYPTDPMVMDEWELEEIFDSEFAQNSGFLLGRCKEIRKAHEAFWSTVEWISPNYIPPDPPITEDERTCFNEFHGHRTQVYSCVLPGEIVHQCVKHIRAGTLDPVNQLRTEHLIVDEFQDLNPCDLEFVDQFIQKRVITFVAGDDDQSIYSFRFAFPEGIQSFTEKYPNAGKHVLKDCFRCTPDILDSASSVIAAHPLPKRIPKMLKSLYVSAEPPLQGRVYRWIFPCGAAEARAIAESCCDLIQAGIPSSEIIILASDTKVLGPALRGALDKAEILYEYKSDGYINSPEGRLALACLRIICKENDYVAHRIVLGLHPGVGPGTCHKIAAAVMHNSLNFRDMFFRPLPADVFQGRELKALEAARNALAELSEWQPNESLAQRSDDIENLLGGILGDVARQSWMENTSHLPRDTTLEEIRDCLWADTAEQKAEVLNTVYQRLGQSPPDEGVHPQRVQIMTMHSAKGLSAQVVFIPGLEEEICPGKWRRPYPGLVLEAARLVYMSLSRARAACILSYARSRFTYGKFVRNAPSRFATDLGGTFTLRREGLSQQEVSSIVKDCNLL